MIVSSTGVILVSENADAQAENVTPAATSRETLSLDQGWRFHLGDIPSSAFVPNQYDPQGTFKSGEACGAAAPKFNDTGWRTLDLPHDWVVEQPFDPKAIDTQGYRPRGIGWYRRQFKLPASDRGKNLELQLDGVATHSTVWFNGVLVGRNWSGYTSSYLDISPLAHCGEGLNTIAVRVDADAMEGWWYEGGGIYRHTWLVKRSPLHIVTNGVYANPEKSKTGQWNIPAEITLENSSTKPASARVEVSITDPDGKQVASGQAATTAGPFQQAVVMLPIPVPSPRLWSIANPNLYKVTAKVLNNEEAVDEVSMNCGFRTIEFTVDKGFFLNGQHLKIHGVCNHLDHAGVGVAVPDSLWEFRLRKLKEMGVNACRTSHNPPPKELLDLCDRMGILVMDVNRHFSSSLECVQQLQWMVRRDRNHPSVFLWSLFNEENPLQGTEQGREVASRLAAAVKSLDTTRPVTAAQNRGQLNPENAAQALDVVGINYQAGLYDQIHAAFPDKPMISSEDTSQVMTRGEYITDHVKHILSSYDEPSNGGSSTHRDAWKAIASRPWMAGDFIWTGFDYHGEPVPLNWPTTGSSFGCLDLCGFPKVAYFIHQAQWVTDKPVLQLVPHWNWVGREGKPVKVMALTNADTVALSLNGKPLGEKSVDPFQMVSWDVSYEPGKLEGHRKEGW